MDGGCGSRLSTQVDAVVDGPLSQAVGERSVERPVAPVHGSQHVDRGPQGIVVNTTTSGPSLPCVEGGDALAMDVDGMVNGVEQIGRVTPAQVVVDVASLCLRQAVSLD